MNFVGDFFASDRPDNCFCDPEAFFCDPAAGFVTFL